MYNRRALKREAKQHMRESTPHYMLVLLVYILLTTGLSYVSGFLTELGGILDGAIGMFLSLLISLFSMVMSVGLANYALNLARGRSTAVGDLFEGFSFAGRSIGLNILVAIYTFLWSLLGAVGVGVIVAVAALFADSMPALIAVLAVVAYIGLIVYMVAVTLRYAMAQFALAENPDDGASAAIRRSVQMMRGNKGKLFMLELSFIGWGLLCALIVLAVMSVGVMISGVDWFLGLFQSLETDPFGIYTNTMELIGNLSIWTVIAEVVCLPLTLWLTAYRQTAVAHFYNYVSGYDYHQYMNEGCQETPVAVAAENPPVAEPAEPAEPFTPPGGFYIPAPQLDEPEEEVEEETEEE